MLLTGLLFSFSAAVSHAADEVRIIAIEGSAEIIASGARRGVVTQTTNQVLAAGDRLSVQTNSRVRLLVSGRSVITLGAGAVIEVAPPDAEAKPGLQLFRGLLSFFHRDRPGRIRILTPGATAGVEGTEFVIRVETTDGVETTTFSLIDGQVSLTNPQGSLTLTNGQQAVAQAGQAPRPIAGFIANNVQQWALYYPAVLDLRDLPLTAAEREALAPSLTAYQSGDLLAALSAYPADRTPASDAEKVYRAALLLSVGEVADAQLLLAGPNAGAAAPTARLAKALQQMIAAVKLQPSPAMVSPSLPTELLAASYDEQSRAQGDASLKRALALARQAATHDFSFAAVRVAELEFSFGRTRQAEEALDKSLQQAPRNAQALALKGFLAAARNQTAEAAQWFDRALAVDPALGNAWLGRGLTTLHRTPSWFSIPTRGTHQGLQAAAADLTMAAALEPQRSLFRSYLGKAFGETGDGRRALHELGLARTLDPNDPTPWLYSALENWQQNRVNEAVDDLERSIALNDNRALFRSRLRLDEDEAVRSASLAKVLRSAGLDDVSLREAATAVGHDYANFSAHQFMAESFDALRDPTRFNLRYETVWFNELLLANMFAPAGAGLLSQHLSQQEYTSLFDRQRLNFLTTTEYRSDGQYREIASQSGSFGNTAWALDLDYQHNNGFRPNNELDRLEWYTTLKQQLTPRDSLMLLTKFQDYHSGDNRQLYSAADVDRNFTFDEDQKPLLYAGYRHEWAPGVHTLVAAGRLVNDQRVSDQDVSSFLYTTNGAGGAINPGGVNASFVITNLAYRSEFETFPFEINQILQDERQILNVGGRFQFGQFDTHNELDGVRGDPTTVALFRDPPADDAFDEQFRRLSLYAYYTREIWDNFRLTAGVAYDDMEYPANYRFPPITAGTAHRSRWLPKVALNWTPGEHVQVRGIYSQSSGGVSFDESFRLEPTQLAGFSQAFRTLISESEVGSVAGAAYEIFGAALDLKLRPRSYLTLSGQLLRQNVDQDVGVFYFSGDPLGPSPQIVPGPLEERLRYEEITAAVAFNQLISDMWVVGARYRFTDSTLKTSYPEVPDGLVTPRANAREEADLHQVELFAMFTHPSGFFARGEAWWFLQDNDGYATARPGDEFAQFNIYAGYRLPRQRGAIMLGVLNLGGDDYHLNSLTPYNELPHERVFLARLRLNF